MNPYGEILTTRSACRKFGNVNELSSKLQATVQAACSSRSLVQHRLLLEQKVDVPVKFSHDKVICKFIVSVNIGHDRVITA